MKKQMRHVFIEKGKKKLMPWTNMKDLHLSTVLIIQEQCQKRNINFYVEYREI